ncbi:MAG TPA: response regulator [Terriglobales bacterium]|nr:response regulator [Terriglobales bacterium]
MPRAATSIKNCSSTPLLWRSDRPTGKLRKKRPACSGRPTLLWIDDYALGLELYRAMFEKLGFKVLTASNGVQGVTLARENHVDVVVTDYEMPGMNGEAVAAAVKNIDPELPVVLFSGSTLVSPRARGLFDAFCDKAASRNLLTATIQRMLLKKGRPFLQPQPESQASDEAHRTVA